MDLTDIDAVIVDLDGTMVDTLGDFCAALNRMLGDLPAPYATHQVDRHTVAELVGKGSEHLIKNVLALADQAAGNALPSVGAQAALALQTEAWAHYQRHYRAINCRRVV